MCLEVFVPGGILGTIGFFLIVGSIWVGFVRLGRVGGSYFLLGSLTVAMLAVYFTMRFGTKTKLAKRLFLLTTEEEFKSFSEEIRDLQGKEGITLTPLRPSGKALIDGRKIDVVTEGVFVPKDCRVRVVRTEGNRVIVRKAEGL